jgi:tetratricopeptide (TPR) repeat protein
VRAREKAAHKKDQGLERLVCLFLIVGTLTVFWQVQHHDFIELDDRVYVTDNDHVQAGLTKEGVVWAFTTFHAANWHPLTWLSHMLDCQLFGVRPGMHHLTNLLIHIANSILLLLVLNTMTGALWRSAFVAALFALHPLHVESVAWVSERKDVLSTLFWLLTMWGYARYVDHPGLNRYLMVLLLFALGLMAKPMLVTLPFVLLLLDYWPFGRVQLRQSSKGSYTEAQGSSAFHLVLEKAPLFALAAVSSVLTLLAQYKAGALKTLDIIPVEFRSANALVSYMSYIGKMIWPHNLAVFYPHPGMVPMWQAVGAGLFLVCLSILFVIPVGAGRRFPYLTVGWLWYLGTLVPVIGLVQVGSQAMADRYTYIPLIGLFIMISWSSYDFVRGWRNTRVVLAISTGVVLLALMACTWVQVGLWKNSTTLFKHAFNVTDNNYKAHNLMGIALERQGRLKEALRQYSEALRIKSDYPEAYYNTGNVLMRQKRLKEALRQYSEALRIKPEYPEAHNNMGVALARQGRLKEAINHFYAALRIKPDFSDAHDNLGVALAQQGRIK